MKKIIQRKNIYEGDNQTEFRNVNLSGEDYETPYYDYRKIDELKKIYSNLSKSNSKTIDDEKTKIKIAHVSYDIVQDTPLNRTNIIDRANILSTFIDFKFNDELDEIFAKTISLVPPENNAPSEIYEVWSEIEEMLRTYLKGKGIEIEEYI